VGVTGAAVEESTINNCLSDRGFPQDIPQIFVKLPGNDIDFVVTKLAEGRNRPIILEGNFTLGTFPEQDANWRVKTG